MICTKCKVDKEADKYWMRHDGKRQIVCAECMKQDIKNYTKEKKEIEKELKFETMKTILKDVIEACESRNSRRLKQCVDRAKVTIGGYYTRKVVARK